MSELRNERFRTDVLKAEMNVGKVGMKVSRHMLLLVKLCISGLVNFVIVNFKIRQMS